MKALFCEMCNSNDLVKQGGLFVCQNCGTKYTVEDAKKMMVDGVVQVNGSVNVENIGSLKNYIKLSQDAYDGGNGQSCLEYANKALELKPNCTEALMLKMKSIEYLATFGDLRLPEVIIAGKAVLTLGDKEDMEEEVYSYYLTRALSLMKIAMNKIADSKDIQDLHDRLMWISPLTVNSSMHSTDTKVVDVYGKVGLDAVELTKAVPNDALARYSSLRHILSECSKQFKYLTEATQKRFAIYGTSFTKEALKARTQYCEEMSSRAEKAEDEYYKSIVTRKELLKIKEDFIQEKNNFVKEAAEDKREIEALIEEKKQIGLFKINEKNEIENRITKLRRENTKKANRREERSKEIESKLKKIELALKENYIEESETIKEKNTSKETVNNKKTNQQTNKIVEEGFIIRSKNQTVAPVPVPVPSPVQTSSFALNDENMYEVTNQDAKLDNYNEIQNEIAEPIIESIVEFKYTEVLDNSNITNQELMLNCYVLLKECDIKQKGNFITNGDVYLQNKEWFMRNVSEIGVNLVPALKKVYVGNDFSKEHMELYSWIKKEAGWI